MLRLMVRLCLLVRVCLLLRLCLLRMLLLLPLPVAPALSADAVRAELAAKCAAGFRTQVQALINSYGAAKFSEVAPEHYPALLEAVACLGVGGEDHAG